MIHDRFAWEALVLPIAGILHLVAAVVTLLAVVELISQAMPRTAQAADRA